MRLFLSYQRSDSRHVAGRLRDRIVQELGPETVFFDVDSISIGLDVREVIRESITAADIFIVLIGSNWDVQKLARVNDYVHLEILEALHQKKFIVPVLLDDRSMPSPDSLPPDIQALAYRNAARLRADPDFQADCKRLIRDLQDAASPSRSSSTSSTQGREAIAPRIAETNAAVVRVSREARRRLITVRVDGQVHVIDYRVPLLDSFNPVTVTLDGVEIYRDEKLANGFNFTIEGRGKHQARIDAGWKGLNKIHKLRLSIDDEVIYSDGY